MITIKIYGKNDCFCGFEISGHAGYSEHGKDIVCASVSVLAINTVNSIEQFTNDRFELKESPDGSGYLYFYINNPSYESELLLNSFVIGVSAIYENYGKKYLKIVY